jgi:hypothetical protein
MMIEDTLLRIEDGANFKFSIQNDSRRSRIDLCFCSETAGMGGRQNSRFGRDSLRKRTFMQSHPLQILAHFRQCSQCGT